jgi:hypothetical protein
MQTWNCIPEIRIVAANSPHVRLCQIVLLRVGNGTYFTFSTYTLETASELLRITSTELKLFPQMQEHLRVIIPFHTLKYSRSRDWLAFTYRSSPGFDNFPHFRLSTPQSSQPHHNGSRSKFNRSINPQLSTRRFCCIHQKC